MTNHQITWSEESALDVAVCLCSHRMEGEAYLGQVKNKVKKHLDQATFFAMLAEKYGEDHIAEHADQDDNFNWIEKS